MGRLLIFYEFCSFYGQRVPLDATLSFYTATQHAVLSYNENLRKELELVDSKIRVSVRYINLQ